MRIPGFVPFAASLLVLPALIAQSVRVEATPLRTITKICDLKALSEREAAKSYPVRIQAVVTFHAPGEDLTFVQDATGAAYINDVDRHHYPIHAGLLVEVEGITDPGRFAPMIVARNIRVLGSGKIPKPVLLRSEEMNTGRLDSLFAESEGVVHSFVRASPLSENQTFGFSLKIVSMAERMTIWVPYPGSLDPGSLIGAKIRAYGPIVANGNRRRQLTDTFQVVQSPKDIRVIEREKVDPGLAPPEWIGKLMTYEPNRSGPVRVRLQGVVTLVRSGRYVTLQKGGSGVSVETDQAMKFTPGTIVDAIGFPSYSRYSPVLREADVRVMASGPPPEPLTIDARSADEGEHDLQLVRFQAEVLSSFHGQDEQAMRLRSGKTTFIAVMDEWQPPNAIDTIEIGSKVEIAGVVRNHVLNGEPAGFQLLLRSADDVRVVGSPPWKFNARTLQILAWGAVVLLVVIVSNIVLRRQVKSQTAEIERIADFERERNSILELVGRQEDLNCVLERIRKLVEREIPGSRCQIRLALKGPVAIESRVPELSSDVAPILAAGGGVLGTLSIHVSGSRAKSATGLGSPTVTAQSAAQLASIAIEHFELFDRLTRQSQQDTLTGLANRLLLQDRLAEAVRNASRERQRVACIYIDLDGFKQINDLWGHRAGDIVLQAAAVTMKKAVRWNDTVARIGGDEFCIILTGLEEREPAEAIARELIESLQMPVAFEGTELMLSASIGLSFFPEHGVSLAELQRNADSAMYLAKRAGKGRLALYQIEESLRLQETLG